MGLFNPGDAMDAQERGAMKKLLVSRTAKAHQKQHESTLDTPPTIR